MSSAINLFYLAKPTYGGWVSFTAHLAHKHNLKIYKITKRDEAKQRPYGYDLTYRNVSAASIKDLSNPLITAIDKNFYEMLTHFPDNTFIVIHDPAEVSKKGSEHLLTHLRRFRIITIRKSVQTYLQVAHNLQSTFLLHPFHSYPISKSEGPTQAVSISRIDYDKHIDIILHANKILPTQKIKLYGAVNGQYVHFKLKTLDFHTHYNFAFKKTFSALNDVLQDARFVIDMSVIKKDGGGSQYTFLEAIHHDCALIINKDWIKDYETPYVHNENCYVVNGPQELADLLTSDINEAQVIKNAKKLLLPHINIDWINELARI